MITTAFLTLIFAFVYIVTAPLRLTADVSLPAAFTAAIVTAGQYLSSVQAYFPIDTLLIVLSFVIGVEIAIGVYKAIMWLIRRIPTQS